jgi:hypothetical protein
MAERYSRPVEEITEGTVIRYDNCWRRVVGAPRVGGSRFKRGDEWVNYVEVPLKGLVWATFPGSMIETRPTPERFRAEVVPYARGFKGAVITEIETKEE